MVCTVCSPLKHSTLAMDVSGSTPARQTISCFCCLPGDDGQKDFWVHQAGHTMWPVCHVWIGEPQHVQACSAQSVKGLPEGEADSRIFTHVEMIWNWLLNLPQSNTIPIGCSTAFKTPGRPTPPADTDFLWPGVSGQILAVLSPLFCSHKAVRIIITCTYISKVRGLAS